MNTQRAGLRVAALIFGVVCLAHLWRVIQHVDVRIGQSQLPMWVSIAGIIVAASLSIWLWSLSKNSETP